MTNLEYLRQLPIKKIAEILLAVRVFEDYDYNYDEEMEYRGLDSVYVCSDGKEFEDYDDALKHEAWWLKQERKEDYNG